MRVVAPEQVVLPELLEGDRGPGKSAAFGLAPRVDLHQIRDSGGNARPWAMRPTSVAISPKTRRLRRWSGAGAQSALRSRGALECRRTTSGVARVHVHHASCRPWIQVVGLSIRAMSRRASSRTPSVLNRIEPRVIHVRDDTDQLVMPEAHPRLRP